MTLNLFSQFSPPSISGISLMTLAMLAPWLMFFSTQNRWLPNRTVLIQELFVKLFAKQIFLPLNTTAHKWALAFTSLMVFVAQMNYLGLLPYVFTPTTQLSLNLGLAIPFWLATVLIGFRNQPSLSLAHMLPEGTPTPLIPVLIVIETISLIIRPLALGVRLTANLTAGHLLMQLTSMATLALSNSPFAMTLTFLALILLTILEIAVAAIQAYVFILLLSLYLQENT